MERRIQVGLDRLKPKMRELRVLDEEAADAIEHLRKAVELTYPVIKECLPDGALAKALYAAHQEAMYVMTTRSQVCAEIGRVVADMLAVQDHRRD